MKTVHPTRPSVSDGQTSRIIKTALFDLMNITWRMTVPTVLGVGLGILADHTLHVSPFGFLTGAVLGFATGIWMAVLVLKKVSKLEKTK